MSLKPAKSKPKTSVPNAVTAWANSLRVSAVDKAKFISFAEQLAVKDQKITDNFFAPLEATGKKAQNLILSFNVFVLKEIYKRHGYSPESVRQPELEAYLDGLHFTADDEKSQDLWKRRGLEILQAPMPASADTKHRDWIANRVAELFSPTNSKGVRFNGSTFRKFVEKEKIKFSVNKCDPALDEFDCCFPSPDVQTLVRARGGRRWEMSYLT